MIKAVITDIEGTTTSLSFVKDVLFPYARENLRDFIQSHASDPAVLMQLEETARVANLVTPSRGGEVELLIDQLIVWIDEDQKVTPLKALQGMLWKQGYEQGHYTAHVYADAVQALRDWQGQGLRLFVYSSGSVQAQKLLFAHTEQGDLTELFEDYFDTRVGPKVQADSYTKIAATIGLAEDQILFLTDLPAECEAARSAGLVVVQLVRDGHLEESPWPQVRSFAAIDPAGLS